MPGSRLVLLALTAASAWGCGGVPTEVADGGGAGWGGGPGGNGGQTADGGPDGAAGDGGAGTGGGAIVVDTPPGQVATETWDGYCDLLEAIEAANTDRTVRECPAGQGADRIVLKAGSSYPVTRTLRIDGAVRIETAEGSAERATIAADAGFAIDPNDRWSGCLLYSSGREADLTLADLELTQHPSVSLTGACATFGRLHLRRARVTGFHQGGIAGYCLPELGCDHETSDDATLVEVLGSLIEGNRSPRNGGGIFSEGSGVMLVVEHSAVVNNASEASGGGLYFGGGWGTHRIENSTVSGNVAASGGGALVRFAACTATYVYVLNSTIAYNTAASTGGGVQFEGQVDCYAQDVTVVGSIISNNTALATAESNINADWDGGMFTCDSGSLIYVSSGLPRPALALGTPCRFDVPDARLAPLQPMGGTGNLPVHVPLSGSPAIDVGEDVPGQAQQRDGWIPLFDPSPPPEWTLFDRVVDGDGDGIPLGDVGAYEVNEVWETELLTVQAKGTGAHSVVTEPAGYHRGGGTHYEAGGAGGQHLTYLFSIAEAGTYALGLGVRRTGSAGQLQAAIADGAGGPWTELGPVRDTYAAAPDFAELELAADHRFMSSGQKHLRLTVVDKNANSLGHDLFLDYLRVRRLQ